MADQIPKNSKADQNAAWAADQMKKPSLVQMMHDQHAPRMAGGRRLADMMVRLQADVARAYVQSVREREAALQQALDAGRIGHLRADILQRAPIQHFLTPDQLDYLREAGTLEWLVLTPEEGDEDER